MSVVSGIAEKVTRARTVRCKLCRESRTVEVDTWDDRVEPTFEHDCKGKGPKLSHPVTRDGTPIPFFPIGERIVVERIPEDTTYGLMYVPETSRAPQQLGTIIAAGPVAQGILDDAGIAIGDTISFAKYVGIGWDWQPAGTVSVTERHSVDLISVKDIFGCKELAEKMIDGRLGIGIHDGDGTREYRFLEYVGPEK